MPTARTLIENTMARSAQAAVAELMGESSDYYIVQKKVGDSWERASGGYSASERSKALDWARINSNGRVLRVVYNGMGNSTFQVLAVYKDGSPVLRSMGEGQQEYVHGIDPRIAVAEVAADTAKYLTIALQRLEIVDLDKTDGDDRSSVRSFIAKVRSLQHEAVQLAETEKMHGMRAELDMGT